MPFKTGESFTQFLSPTPVCILPMSGGFPMFLAALQIKHQAFKIVKVTEQEITK